MPSRPAAYLACLLVLGCGDEEDDAQSADAGLDARTDVAADAARDARTMDARRVLLDAEPGLGAESGFDADAGQDLCIDIREDCEPDYQGPWLTTLLRAADYGADAEFVAMGGDAVLVRHDAEYEVLRLNVAATGVARFAVPSGWRGIDVHHVLDTDSTVWLLACRDPSACAVFVGTDPAQPLAQLGAALPFAAWTGLTPSAWDWDSWPATPCVYGAGLTCLRDNGEWFELVAPSIEVAAARFDLSGAVATVLTASGELRLAGVIEGFDVSDVSETLVPGRVRSFLEGSTTIVTDRTIVDRRTWRPLLPQCSRSDLVLTRDRQDGPDLLFADGRFAFRELHCIAQHITPLTDLVATDVGGMCRRIRVLTERELLGDADCQNID